MPYTMEDLERDAAQTVLSKLTPEQRLQGLPPEALLAHLSPEQRLQGLAPEQVFSHFSLTDLENYFKKLKAAQEQAEREPS